MVQQSIFHNLAGPYVFLLIQYLSSIRGRTPPRAADPDLEPYPSFLVMANQYLS